MQISELIATLHHEVAKSYTYIAEIKGGSDAEASVLHINIERMEIELPVTLSQQDIEFNPQNFKGSPRAFKKLFVPFLPQTNSLPQKLVKGKTIDAEVIGHVEKIDDRVSPDSIGRIKIMFKVEIS